MNNKSIESLLSRLYEEESLCGTKEAFIEICRHYSMDQFFLGSCHYHKDGALNFELYSDSYPVNWMTHYVQNKYNLDDPRLKEYGKIRPPYTWELDKKNRELSAVQQNIFKESCDFGVAKGLTVPFYPKNGIQPLLSVFNQKTLHPEALHILTFATKLYFERKKFFESKKLISNLTPREHEILTLKSEGLSTKSIADRLQISEHTITFHLINIKKKLHTKSIDHTMFKFGVAAARSN